MAEEGFKFERRRGYLPNHGTTPDQWGHIGLGGFMMDPKKTGKIAMKAAKTVAKRAKMLVEADAGAGEQLRDGGGRFQSGSGKSLANSYKVHQTVVVLNENPPNPRLSAVVINDARHAARWEFGISSKNHKGAHRSLRRAAMSVGEWRGVNPE